jgi:hypothetical protein
MRSNRMWFSWATTQLHRPKEGTTKRVTLIPGIGIGPEIASTFVASLRECGVHLRRSQRARDLRPDRQLFV